MILLILVAAGPARPTKKGCYSRVARSQGQPNILKESAVIAKLGSNEVGRSN